MSPCHFYCHECGDIRNTEFEARCNMCSQEITIKNNKQVCEECVEDCYEQYVIIYKKEKYIFCDDCNPEIITIENVEDNLDRKIYKKFKKALRKDKLKKFKETLTE